MKRTVKRPRQSWTTAGSTASRSTPNSRQSLTSTRHAAASTRWASVLAVDSATSCTWSRSLTLSGASCIRSSTGKAREETKTTPEGWIVVFMAAVGVVAWDGGIIQSTRMEWCPASAVVLIMTGLVVGAVAAVSMAGRGMMSAVGIGQAREGLSAAGMTETLGDVDIREMECGVFLWCWRYVVGRRQENKQEIETIFFVG